VLSAGIAPFIMHRLSVRHALRDDTREGAMKQPHRRQFLHLAAGAAVLPAVQPMTPAAAQSGPPSTREVPARSIPVPDTVSPQMQAVIARPFNPNFNLVPETTIDWKKRVDDAARNVVATLPRLREALGVSVEPTMMGGVKAFIVTPKAIPPSNRDRVLLHLHGLLPSRFLLPQLRGRDAAGGHHRRAGRDHAVARRPDGIGSLDLDAVRGGSGQPRHRDDFFERILGGRRIRAGNGI